MASTPTLMTNSGTVLTVGAGMEFATLGDACKAAVSGDTIAVRAGTYTNDFAVVTTNLRIIAVGGMVNEVATRPPPNDKALITADASLNIQGFTFTGGSDGSPDGNVSGIRVEAGNLSVGYCYFHDMQEGLLAGADAGASITIDHSEFARNGTGDGYSHNLYVGAIGSLTITNSYFHDAVVGHEIKSRAAITTITNNVIADGAHGTASYDIDLPNAGVARVANNLIEKGPNASNYYAIHYGGEGQFVYANNALTVTGNTILNDLGANGLAVLNQCAVTGLNVNAAINGNRFYGFDPARLLMGAGTLSGNTTLAQEPGYSTASPWTGLPIINVAGPEVLMLDNSGHAIIGSLARLSVTDTGGSNTITGGAGGLAANAVAGWDVISTLAGAHDTLTLSGRNCVVQSAGSDVISAPGTYEDVIATGAATIAGGGFSTYRLDGAGEHLTTSCSGVLDVGAAGLASVIDLAGDLNLTLAAGGVLAISDQAQAAQHLVASTATVSGGAATGVIGNGGAISLTLGDGGARIQAGTGAMSVTGGAGVDSYVFTQGQHGTDTITGFKPGTDVLQFQGFTGAAVASGTIVGGSTVLTLTDGTTIDLVAVALPGYAGPTAPPAPPPGAPQPPPAPPGVSGNGTLILTNAGHAVAGGAAALTVLDFAGGNTVAGGAGGLSANAGCYDVVSTQAGAADQLTLSRYDTLSGAGADTVSVGGYANHLAFAGAATVALAGGGNAVQGGAGLLTVADQVGGDSLAGGAGGLVANLAGLYDSVTTAQGAADTVSLAGQSTLLSQGTDDLAVRGNYNQVTAMGAATIAAGAGFSTYTLDGADSLSGPGGGVVTVGSAASATISSAGGQDLGIIKLAGGTLLASETLSGVTSSLSVSGGAASVTAATGAYAGLRASFGAGVTLNAGAGNVTLTGGAGHDSIAGGPGSAIVTLGEQDSVSLGGGSITVQGGAADVFIVPPDEAGRLVVMNWSAQDSFMTPGLAAPAITAETVSGGSTWLTFAGGAQAELVGVGVHV